MKSILLLCFIFIQSSYALNIEVFDTAKKSNIKFSELMQATPDHGHFLLGEFHSDELIQKVQAILIKDKTIWENKISDVTINWEFLNYTDVVQTIRQYERFRRGDINSLEFIELAAGKNLETYAPIIDASKQLNALLFGANLPRSIKQKVIQDGIDSIDPRYVPDFHFDGGPAYKERFEIAMGGHIPSEKLDAYFTAQCLTDSTMARELHKNEFRSLNFTIVGSFHTDHFDGTVTRLKMISKLPITTFKFVNAENLDEIQIQNYKKGSSLWGDFANFIIFVKK